MKCSICDNYAQTLCEKKDRFGRVYRYSICKNCRFIFENDLAFNNLNLQKRTADLYKDDYFNKTDSGWQARGDKFLKIIRKVIKIYSLIKNKKEISILDYGGGNGYIASKLAQNFNVFCYDKYENPTIAGKYKILKKPIKTDIIYAVETVEHITDIKEWDFLKEFSPDIFIFTTGLSDNISNKEISNWPYLNSDAGHMAIYSCKSLYLLGKKYGFIYFFFPNISCHFFLNSKILSRINFVKLEYFFYNFFRKIKHTFK